LGKPGNRFRVKPGNFADKLEREALCQGIYGSPARTGLFRALRPDSEFAVIAGAGHLPQQEKPEACVEWILRFLSEPSL